MTCAPLVALGDGVSIDGWDDEQQAIMARKDDRHLGYTSSYRRASTAAYVSSHVGVFWRGLLALSFSLFVSFFPFS